LFINSQYLKKLSQLGVPFEKLTKSAHFSQIFVSFYEKIRKNAQKYETELIFRIPKSRCKRLQARDL